MLLNTLSYLASKAKCGLKRTLALDALIAILAVLLITSPFQPKLAYAEKNSLESQKVTLSLQNQSLAQALKCLATQLNIEISTNGQFPQETGSVNLEDLKLGKAIDRLMKAFGIDNHATLYDMNQRVVYLNMMNSTKKVCIPTAPEKSLLKQEKTIKAGDRIVLASGKHFEEEIGVREKNQRLTEEEMAILRSRNAHSATLADDSQSPLSDRQKEILKQKSKGFAPQDNHGAGHLTEEQQRKLAATTEDNQLL